MIDEEIDLCAPLVRIEVAIDRTIDKLAKNCKHDLTHFEEVPCNSTNNGEHSERAEFHRICSRCDKDVCPKRIHD